MKNGLSCGLGAETEFVTEDLGQSIQVLKKECDDHVDIKAHPRAGRSG